MKIVWTEAAIRDLTAARVEQPGAAKRQAQLILSAVATLASFREAARPGRRAGTRELVVPHTPLFVPYRIRGEVIAVLRALHGRQRWPEGM